MVSPEVGSQLRAVRRHERMYATNNIVDVHLEVLSEEVDVHSGPANK